MPNLKSYLKYQGDKRVKISSYLIIIFDNETL